MSTQILLLPAYPYPIPLAQARHDLPGPEFRARLREAMLATPQITLSQVAAQLGVTRQAVNQLVGKLDRPSCASPNRPAPKLEQARRRLEELVERVRAGESADHAAADLGISLAQAMRLGFRSKAVRPAHGTQARLAHGCDCWRCRRAAGRARPRGRRVDLRQQAEVLDWLAYRDPDDETALTQAEVGRLVGVGQPVVSRIARAVEQG